MDYGYESEINLKDMMLYVLYKWRTVLLAAVILCALFSGYKGIRNLLQSDEYNEKPKKIQQYELDLAEYELNMATSIQDMAVYQEWLKQQEIYMEQSVLMQTNPYQKPLASTDIFVKLAREEWDALPDNLGLDPTDSLIKMYTSNFHSIIDWEPLEKMTGKENIYLKELIGLSTDYNSNTFSVYVTYSDGETALKILNNILEQIMLKYQELNKNVNEHTITFVNQSMVYVIDNGLVSSQKNNNDTITDYERIILNYQRKLMELKENEPVKPFVFGFVKYPIVGFLAGGFLLVMYYAICYLFGGRLHNEEELKGKYGYQLLGKFPEMESVGTSRFFVDRILDSIAGSKEQTEEEGNRRVARNLINLAGNARKILLTGTVNCVKLQRLAEKISSHLGEDIILLAAEDMNRNTNTLKTLAECDAVILAEQKDKSLLREIEKEHDSILALDKPVVGYILLQ